VTKPGWASTARWSRARRARQRGATEVNQWLNPLKGGTGSNLVDLGRATVRAVLYSRGQRLRSRPLMSAGRPSPQCCGFGGGEAVAAELGADPVDRHTVNVGTLVGLPSPSSSLLVGGQAHRRPLAWRGGGGSVVVRDRESRSHGEGTQRVRSRCDGTPGGRR
jgi:hypothetical protein